MRRKLFTIEDRFKIPERGIVVVGDYQPNLPEIKLEDALVLVLPDGTAISSASAGVEYFQTVSGNKKMGILIRNLTKEDFPIGTEIFLETADEQEN